MSETTALEAALTYVSSNLHACPYPIRRHEASAFLNHRMTSAKAKSWWGMTQPVPGIGVLTGTQLAHGKLVVLDVHVDAVGRLAAKLGPTPTATGNGRAYLYTLDSNGTRSGELFLDGEYVGEVYADGEPVPAPPTGGMQWLENLDLATPMAATPPWIDAERTAADAALVNCPTLTLLTSHVQLSWDEVEWAAQVGLQRHLLQRKRGAANLHGLDGHKGVISSAYAWGIDIEGACGELAFAKSLGLEWEAAIDTFEKPDVAGFQVRTVGGPTHQLIVRPKSAETDQYALVLGRVPQYSVIGHIDGKSARQPTWSRREGGRPEAWFVPQTALSMFDSNLLNRLQRRGLRIGDVLPSQCQAAVAKASGRYVAPSLR